MAIVRERINLDISYFSKIRKGNIYSHMKYLMRNRFLFLLALKIWINSLRSPRT